MKSGLDKNFFGLDISDLALRLVKLEKKGKKIILSSYNEVRLPQGVITEGIIKEKIKLAEAVNKLIKETKGKKINTKNLITALPEPKTFIKVIDIPKVPEEKIKETVEKEIENHIPLNLDEIYLDWQVFNDSPHDEKIKMLIGAAPKEVVNSYLSFFNENKFVPYAFEIEAAAIARSLMNYDSSEDSKIIIDFGAVRTGLIVYDHGAVQLTVSLPISGDKITDSIKDTLNIDRVKAEKAKIVCGLDKNKCEGALLKILNASIEKLATQIKKSINFYQANFPDNNKISEIILCGGGANFLQIDQILSEKLSLPVKIGNPMIHVQQTKKSSLPKNKVLSYTTAIGLALRAQQKKII